MIGYFIGGWLLLGLLGFIIWVVHEYFTCYWIEIKVNHLSFILTGPFLLLAAIFTTWFDICDKTIIKIDGWKGKKKNEEH